MNKISKLVMQFSLATVYSFCSLNAAYADDTEVFFAPSSSVVDVKPNVMFIIDTSGSMAWGVDGTRSVPYDEKRINIVKSVMNDLLTDLNNVNAGLMRFNRGNSSGGDARGGPVLFPVLDIDLPATPIVEQEVSVGENDGYEDPNTKMWISENKLYLDGASADYTAVRFTALNIPQGAKIKRASIGFTANGDSSGAALFNIYAQKIDSAPVLVDVLTDISSRMPTATTKFIEWSPEDWKNGESYVSSDISEVIQEVVDQAGWCGGNDLMIMVEGTDGAERIAYSSEGEAIAGSASEFSDDVSAAKIRIEYEPILPSGATGCITGDERAFVVAHGDHDAEDNYYSGNVGGNVLDFQSGNTISVGFQNVNISRNSSITDAFIEFTAQSSTSGGASATIVGIDDDQPPMNANMLTATPITTGVSWSGIEDWTTNNVYRTSSVKDIVQTIVNRSDWDSGDDIAFQIDFSSGDRHAYSKNNSANKPARLIIIQGTSTYTPGAITIREDLKQAVNGLPATGNTPISDTIAEAGLYFTGGDVVYGVNRNGHQNNRISHPLSWENGNVYYPSGCSDANPDSSYCKDQRITGSPNYISPIEESCQTNHIVFLTDGAPTAHDSETESIYSSWTGGTSCNHGNAKEDCAVDIAGYLHNNDLSSLSGSQTVNTHMIGFGAGADPALMKKMADAGGGGHYSAQSKDELVNVLKTIINSIASVSTTFVTTGVTVNQYNRLTHSEQLYFSLFTPSSQNVWPGNVKRYRLSGGEIVDVTGKNAIDKLTSEFSDEAKSYWSSSVDGNQVDIGGAAGQLTTSRTIYTNLTSTDIDAAANRFNRTNITSTHLGAANDDDRKTIIDWALGYDVSSNNYSVNDLTTTPAHKNMADPLHSQPTIISYKSSSPGSDRDLVLVGTNDGFLRAFDADENDGTEVWSFLPKELFDRLSSIQKGLVSDHNYGLDGAISVYIDDTNNNGQVDVDSGEKAYLYVGMRRGGRSYYALDISDPNAPSLKFIISGDADVGNGQVTSDYSKLGQTWSRPIIGKMNLSGVNSDKLVMIFGGGYDTAQDLAGTASVTDTVGNIIYIADALTGNLLWTSDSAIDPGESEGPLSMNSIPGDVTAFDLDGDELVDHMYASDTKAQIFRFDVDNTAQTIKGGRIASLQTAADLANNRRFYYSVDAAYIKLIDDSFISVSIGSGYRAHPLDQNVTDHFYMIRDEGVLKKEFDMDITQGDLTDVTSLIGDTNSDGTSDAAAQMKLDGNHGWYIGFTGAGEKVIERSITFNNAVVFTTYLPPSSSSSACVAAAGGSRIYGLRIVDGNPYVDTNYDGNITESDRYAELVGAGIAPPPQVLLEGTDQGVKARLCVGTQCNLEDFLPDTTKGIVGYKWQN